MLFYIWIQFIKKLLVIFTKLILVIFPQIPVTSSFFFMFYIWTQYTNFNFAPLRTACFNVIFTLISDVMSEAFVCFCWRYNVWVYPFIHWRSVLVYARNHCIKYKLCIEYQMQWKWLTLFHTSRQLLIEFNEIVRYRVNVIMPHHESLKYMWWILRNNFSRSKRLDMKKKTEN